MAIIVILLSIIALAVWPQALINGAMLLDIIILTIFRICGVIGSIGFLTWLAFR